MWVTKVVALEGVGFSCGWHNAHSGMTHFSLLANCVGVKSRHTWMDEWTINYHQPVSLLTSQGGTGFRFFWGHSALGGTEDGTDKTVKPSNVVTFLRLVACWQKRVDTFGKYAKIVTKYLSVDGLRSEILNMQNGPSNPMKYGRGDPFKKWIARSQVKPCQQTQLSGSGRAIGEGNFPSPKETRMCF